MHVPKIPTNLDQWSLDTIKDLAKYSDIESEILDLKLEPSKLYEDICAMANTNNGFIILGIGEKKDNNKIIGFDLVGFPKSEQDSISNKIGNFVSNIEPLPLVDPKPIPDDENGVFFTILKITGRSSDKPYFVKGTGQCYVRIQRSSSPVGRSVILNMFSTIAWERQNLERLRSSLLLLIQEVRNTLAKLRVYSPDDQTRTAPIDLSFVRNAVIENQDFLQSHDLLGHRESDSISDGVVPVLHTIETLNEQIKAYNSSYDRKAKSEIKNMIISHGYVLHLELVAAEKTIIKITSKIEEHLSKTI